MREAWPKMYFPYIYVIAYKMTKLQREIFESIIREMKSNNGQTSIYAPTQETFPLNKKIEHSVFREQAAYVIKEMLDTGYIKYRYSNSPFEVMLEDKGWKFNGFDQMEREQERLALRKEKKDELDLLIAERVSKVIL